MGYSGKLAVFFSFFILILAPAAHAGEFNVTRTDDPTPSPAPNGCNTGGSCSLREAVIASNANSEDDTIVLEATSYPLTHQGTGENAAVTGDLDVTNNEHSLTVLGVSAETTIIDAAGLGDRIFEMAGGGMTLNLSRLTLQNGAAGNANGGAVLVSQSGGSNSLHVSDSRLQGNQAMDGGAIWGCCNSSAGLLLERSVLSGNSATGDGGAIFGWSGYAMDIRDSTVDLNEADSDGGGVFASQATFFKLRNSTLSNNSAGGSGGGLDCESIQSTTLENSTFSNNEASTGGGIILRFGVSTIKFRNVTITENTASGEGAGIFVFISTSIDDGTIANSILSANTSDSSAPSPDCFIEAGGSPLNFTSIGHNIFGDVSDCAFSGPGDLAGVADPGLGPLINNGGLTFTHAPALDSPAIDHGDPAGCKDAAGNELTQDQRGEPRPLGLCDSGAVEIASANSEIAVDPLSIDFGDISLEVPNTRSLTITNNEVGVLNVTGMSLSDASNYAVAGGSCGGISFSLAEGESCTAEVTFIPQAEGSFDATLTIASNDPINPSVVVALTGVGVDTGDDGGIVPPPAPASGGCALNGADHGPSWSLSFLVLLGFLSMIFARVRDS